MARQFFDNIVWHALAGPHARFSRGTEEVRRYAAGFSPIVGFADPRRPQLDALTAYCEPGEHFYCDGWSGPAPEGWRIEVEAGMLKMIFDAPAPGPAADEAPEASPLAREHVAQVLELVALTQPGPFGARTIELGDYFGVFDGARLVAMAGERLHAGPLREISGVCTHPDYQRRGLARRLVAKLLRRQLARGEIPCLHVMAENREARRLYEQMGFSVYRESTVRVISRSGTRLEG